MMIRLLAVALLAFSVTACSSTDDTAAPDSVTIGERTDMGANPLSGTEVYGDGSNMGVDGSALPGSQQDLVVNVGDRVFFGYDRYDLTPEAQATLDRQAQWLNQYPNTNITIEGHADERGTREYNIALGERRAEAAKNYLISRGVSPMRLNTISYGKERPAVTGGDPASWAQNRRAVTNVN